MRRFDLAWLLLWGALSTAWCLTASRELSATFDEGLYLKWGLTSWRSGSNFDLMRAGTMPLPVDVEYLPVHVWERVRGEQFDPVRDFHQVLAVARGMNLVFWWLQLVFGTLLARRFAGPWAGRFAVVFLATEPSLLGHACLATTDIAVTAMLLVFAYFWEVGRDKGRGRRWLLPGVLFGVAMAAKASALTFAPILMLAFEIPRLHKAGAFRKPPDASWIGHLLRSTRSFRLDGLWVLIVGMVVLFAICGSDWRSQPRFVEQADKMPEDGTWTPTVRWLAHNLAIFPNAGEGFQYQFKHNIRGHGSNLLGTFHPRAVWYYFPVALTIKLSTPVLVLLVALAFNRRSYTTPLALAVLFLLVFSFTCRVQIGIRLVFPLVAMILLMLAAALARALQCRSETRHWLALGLVSVACAWPAATAWPDGIRYGNDFWGGSANTYKHLSDSNHDWGQGVPDLDRWTAERGLPTAAVWYFGSDPVIISDKERWLLLHAHESVKTPDDVRPLVRGKVVAVSTSLLYGKPNITKTMPTVIEFLKSQQPIGQTRTFFVYDFRDLP